MRTDQTEPKTIDEYIASFPQDVQVILKKIRMTIREAAPGAEETIKYRMPTFTLNGNLVYFAGFKKHIGFYPVPTGIEAFKKELSVYRQGRGSVQFPLEKPIPYGLISRFVKFRVKENLKRAEAKGKKKKYVQYHNDGSIWAKGSMIDGQTDGYFEWFRKDGTRMRSGYFRKGKQVGDWTTYDKKGHVVKVTHMK